jgi:hypothetical protein
MDVLDLLIDRNGQVVDVSIKESSATNCWTAALAVPNKALSAGIRPGATDSILAAIDRAIQRAMNVSHSRAVPEE